MKITRTAEEVLSFEERKSICGSYGAVLEVWGESQEDMESEMAKVSGVIK
jgi:hypothetical protein